MKSYGFVFLMGIVLVGCAATSPPTSAPTTIPTAPPTVFATSAPAAVTGASILEVSNAWVRLAPSTGGALSASGYMTITNHGATPDALTGVSSESFGSAMLHKTTIANDLASMVMVDEIAVPAGGSVDLAPGSFHVMLTGQGKNNSAPPPGGTVALTLLFRSGATLTIDAPVMTP